MKMIKIKCYFLQRSRCFSYFSHTFKTSNFSPVFFDHSLPLGLFTIFFLLNFPLGQFRTMHLNLYLYLHDVALFSWACFCKLFATSSDYCSHFPWIWFKSIRIKIINILWKIPLVWCIFLEWCVVFMWLTSD